MIAARPALQSVRPVPLPRPCTGAAVDPCAPLRLADGRALWVQPLTPLDSGAEQAFVDGLSSQSRYRRFHAGLPALPAGLLRRLVDVDQQAHVALAVRATPGGPIVADARYVRDAAGDEAEYALTVGDDWQGLGLGRQLLLRLAAHARSQGVAWLHGAVLWDNAPMLALVNRLGGQVRAVHGEAGVLQARLRTAAAH